MGRFMSPDWSTNPISIPFARLDNPQTLNMYSYVGNNPLRYFDSSGHCYNETKSSIFTCIRDFFHNLFSGGGSSRSDDDPDPDPPPAREPIFRVTTRIFPPNPITNNPSFYSFSASAGYVSESISYVPRTNNFIIGSGPAAPKAETPGLMLMAGYSRRPEDYLRGSGVQGCWADGVAVCYGIGTSINGGTLETGEPALLLGIGTPAVGGSLGYGYGGSWDAYTQSLYELIPADPMATIPGPAGLNIEDPNMVPDLNP
jgi:hypothetical protein